MHAAMKLGRKAPTADHRKRALPLWRYLHAPLPAAPARFSGSVGAAIGMWGNDKRGNCTFAGAANTRAIRAALTGAPTPPTTEEAVISAYDAYTHGVDEGAVEHDVLALARAGGLQLGGEPWMAVAACTVDLADEKTCKSLVAIFGSLYLGVELPIAAQTQDIWDVSAGPDAVPGSWGGHCLLYSEFDTTGLGLVTWGIVKPAMPGWLRQYGDEAHLILDADSAGRIGVNWDNLLADFQAAGQPE